MEVFFFLTPNEVKGRLLQLATSEQNLTCATDPKHSYATFWIKV